MAYSFQTFTVGQVLTGAQCNQIEANIRDHVHGVAGVSMATRIAKITRAALWDRPLTAGFSALPFDTEVTDNGSYFQVASNDIILIPANGIYTIDFICDQASRFAVADKSYVGIQINSNRLMAESYIDSLSALTTVKSSFALDLFTTFIASTNDIVRILFASDAGGGYPIIGPIGNTVNSGGRLTSIVINQIG